MLALTKPTTAIAMAFPATNARFFPLAIVIPPENDAQGDVNPTANYNYAIRFASEEGHTEVVRLLLERHDVNPGANASSK